jgi:hypothetical protein
MEEDFAANVASTKAHFGQVVIILLPNILT